jgi:CheY-like chemotaxis protein
MKNLKWVYLVDDDQDDRFFIRQAIEQALSDVEIIEAESGVELLSLIHRKGDLSAGLILLDMNMPRMNGVETIEALRSDTKIPFIPVVMISTTTNPTMIKAAFNAGAEIFINKPSTMRGFSELATQITSNYLE